MLTLRQCLEQVIALGADYILTEQGVERSAIVLLATLTRAHPDRLDLPMYLRLPDSQQDGAICQVTKTGYILCYRICPCTSQAAQDTPGPRVVDRSGNSTSRGASP
jgi:hypothetical protein